MAKLNFFRKIRFYIKNKPKLIPITFLFGIVYLIYFSFSFNHISEFITADEHFWVNQRIYTYWNSVFSPDKWSKTKLSDKPGVTVALVSGVGLLKESNPYKTIKDAASDNINEPLVIKSVYTTFRIPFVFFTAFFSIFLFWITKKLTGDFWIAFWSFSLMLLSPTLLGISQITNADAVMWSFSCATLLSFLAYLKTEEKKILILSPIFLGLSLLTKLVSVIFFPFLLLVALLFMIEKFDDWKKDGTDVSKKITMALTAFLITFLGSLVVFSVFMPAVFTDIQIFLEYTIGFSVMKYIVPLILLFVTTMLLDAWRLKSFLAIKILEILTPRKNLIYKSIPIMLLAFFVLTILNWNLGQFLLDPENVLNRNRAELHFLSRYALHENLLYQFYPLVFSLTPIALISILFLWSKFIFKNIKERFLVLILSLFILVFLAALVALDMPAIIRYIIALYPISLILASIGIKELSESKKFAKISKFHISLVLILFSFASLWAIKPFYFNYTSNLLPKEYSIAYAWGYGGYEAAQFMNSLPNAENLTVWSDYYGFRNFFIGTTTTDYIPKKGSAPIDYYILTKQGQIKYDYWCNKAKNSCAKKYVPAGKYYTKENPLWEINIDERPNNFIKIYKSEE
ncbi:MAG: hypothetical protein ACD_8C00047G0016 [uncultured bacterium]|nr:MAG: hypothetical protein ACD_8C00047G0016 [uncultured bacterium]